MAVLHTASSRPGILNCPFRSTTSVTSSDAPNADFALGAWRQAITTQRLHSIDSATDRGRGVPGGKLAPGRIGTDDSVLRSGVVHAQR